MADSMGGILTKGLGADSTSLIVGFFRLKLIVGDIPVTPPGARGGGGTGGSYGRKRDDDDNLRQITLYLTFAKTEIIRQYTVTNITANRLVTIINTLTRVKDKVSVAFRKTLNVQFVRDIKANWRKKDVQLENIQNVDDDNRTT